MMLKATLSLSLLLLLAVLLVSPVAVSCTVPPVNASEGVADDDVAADFSHNPTGSSAQVEIDRIDTIVQQQWEKHLQWKALYKKRWNRYFIASSCKIASVMIGMIVQFASIKVPKKYVKGTSGIGALFIGLGTYIDDEYVTENKITDMVRSYYNSNHIKSEVWKFRTKVGEYCESKGGSSEKVLRDRCEKIYSNTRDDRSYAEFDEWKSKPAPKWNSSQEEAPSASMNTKDAYIEHRVDKMVKNYRRYALLQLNKANFWSQIESVLLKLSLFGGLASASTDIPDSLKGYGVILSGLSIVISTHQETMKHDDIADQYFNAKNELSVLKEKWDLEGTQVSDLDWKKCVIQCEKIICSTEENYAEARAENYEIKWECSC